MHTCNDVARKAVILIVRHFLAAVYSLSTEGVLWQIGAVLSTWRRREHVNAELMGKVGGFIVISGNSRACACARF